MFGFVGNVTQVHWTIDYAPHSRRSTVPTPTGQPSDISVLIAFSPDLEKNCLSYALSVSRSVATIYLLG